MLPSTCHSGVEGAGPVVCLTGWLLSSSFGAKLGLKPRARKALKKIQEGRHQGHRVAAKPTPNA